VKFLEQSDDRQLRDHEFLKAVTRMLSRNGIGDWRRGAFLMDAPPIDPGQKFKPSGVRDLTDPGIAKESQSS
jgi:hypothetical protein